MCGAIPPLPQYTSWRDAQLKYREGKMRSSGKPKCSLGIIIKADLKSNRV